MALQKANRTTSGSLEGSISAVALRPSSGQSLSPLHSASVHVSDFSYLANPVPAGKGREGREEREEILRLGDDYLSPTKLRQLTGESDLSRVTYLEISVNSQFRSLGNFGCSVPSLEQLRCVESVVPCVRDLGTGLTRLTVLWLPHCHLRDLDGLPSLSSLRELYISHNAVSDVSVAAMLPSLTVLDLERNNVCEEDQLGYLGLCPELSSLSLTGNPLADHITHQQGGEAGYRGWILKALPQLKVLDEISVAVLAPPPRSTPDPSLSPSPSLSPLPSSSPAPGLSWTEQTEHTLGLTRPRTALSPGQAGHVPPMEDGSSDLTHGLSQVICGNPVRALKARRQSGISSQSSVLSSSSAHSTSLEALMEELTVTRTTSLEDLTAQVDCSPYSLSSSTPSYISPQRTQPPTSTHAVQTHRLPSPPPTQPSRPHSAADFRYRRYHRPNPPGTRPALEHALSSPTSTTLSLHNHTSS